MSVATYTVREAALALGKTLMTFNRWISEDLIPEPILHDTVRGYRHYSEGEVRIMARVLAEHEREFTYYSTRHVLTQERMHQALFGYRESHI